MEEGTCFAALFRGGPVALSGTHATEAMGDEVGELCVETLTPFRRRGFGKTAVSRVTETLLARERVPLYATSDWNAASARTARSVGYTPYGWQLRIQMRDDSGE